MILHDIIIYYNIILLGNDCVEEVKYSVDESASILELEARSDPRCSPDQTAVVAKWTLLRA